MVSFGSLSIAAFVNCSVRPSSSRCFLYNKLDINASKIPISKIPIGSRICSSTTKLSSSSENTYQEEHQSFSNRKFYVLHSDGDDVSQIEQEISSGLSIPIISQSQQYLEAYVSAYTHCIHVLPYEYGSLQTHAIGIQPVATEPTKQRRRKKNSKRDQMQPIFIDFCPPLQSNLGQRVGGKKQGGEMLLKAVAPGKYGNEINGAIVFDLTAGFGQDSMILASGKTAQVHMVERDPIVALLLSDAMRRLKLIAETVENDDRARDLVKKLSLHKDDAVGFCKRRLSEMNDGIFPMDARPHVCYLDPMFPPRKKSAAVKKNMQILHGLFQTNEKMDFDDERQQEERDLLNEALSLAKSRVVVKRPINAPPLGSPDDTKEDVCIPSFELKGSMNRFDVYIL